MLIHLLKPERINVNNVILLYNNFYHYIIYMLSENKSINFFLFGCMPTRILLSILPIYINKNLLFYYGIVLFIISLSFLYLYFSNLRLNAFEAGGFTWWANFRIIHGLLYMTGAIYSFQGLSIAWIPITLDTIFGLILFIYHRKQALLSSFNINSE